MPIAGSRQDARQLSGIHAFSFSSQVGTTLTLFKGQVLSEGNCPFICSFLFSLGPYLHFFLALALVCTCGFEQLMAQGPGELAFRVS